MKAILPAVALLLCAARPGFADVDIRQPFGLTGPQRKALADLIATDPEARARWQELKQEADAFLDDAPRPLAVIHYEGLVDTNPARVATEKSLPDMDKLVVFTWAWAASGDARYRDKVRQFVLAWVRAFRPTGNSINENKLEPVIAAYETMREAFSAAERKEIEAWLRRIAEAEIEVGKANAAPGQAKTNWHAKRLKLVGLIGLVLEDREFIRYALDGCKLYAVDGLFADGTSEDLRRRDALSYHLSGLKSLLVLILKAAQYGAADGAELYVCQAPSGASIRKSLEFAIPYADGTRTRKEWVNTKSRLDRERAAAGLPYYQPGKPYDPRGGVETFELASPFDRKLLPLVAKLYDRPGSAYPSFLSVVLATGAPPGK